MQIYAKILYICVYSVRRPWTKCMFFILGVYCGKVWKELGLGLEEFLGGMGGRTVCARKVGNQAHARGRTMFAPTFSIGHRGIGPEGVNHFPLRGF